MATSDRRRRVRQLLLQAAKARTDDALTLQSGDDNKTQLFAPFSPSPVAVIDAVWTKLEAADVALTERDLLVDLGCGDGRWLVSGAQRFNCNALGVELDGNLVQRARETVQQQNLQEKIVVSHGDVMQTDISRAKLVIVYAFAESLAGIAEWLSGQLGQDAGVLSIGFRVPGWKPHWSEREGGLRWYFYKMEGCMNWRS